ncbi:MAG: serine/threonine protein kinase [Lachnospiraceae bacterium]|nr:serine/threonine protein kinase [Lachnospiraceae bacterium]
MKIKRCYGCMEPWSGTGPCPHCGYEPGKQKSSLNVLPEGTVLAGKYMIGKTLGAGGFGITYIAWDLNLDMKLAIKEYYPNNFVSRQAEYSHCVSVFNRSYVSQYNTGLEGFLSEAKTLARFVRQPGIVFVRDYFQENDTAYIVMEFAEGQTLKELLAQTPGECLPADQVFAMMLPVMEALVKVHKAGVIHRDISPDNLMVDPDNRVTLLDFGSTRDYTDEKSLSVILKPGYAPEEQYRKRGKQGPWTDIYSLCATMYRAITGQVPMEALDRLEKDELKSPSELGVKIRPEQEKVLMKGLSIRAQDRYQSMEELIGELEVRPIPIPDPKRKFVIGGIAAAAVLVIGIICAAFFSGKQDPLVPETETETEAPRTETESETEPETEIAAVMGIDLSTLSVDEIFADAVTYNGDSQEELYELLASDEVSAVILDSYLGLTTGTLEITKPLLITENSGFDGYVPVVVSGGGYVRIESGGQFNPYEGLLQVTDGGCISVADGGSLACNAFVWLEQEENLLLEEGAELSMNGNSFASLNEALETVPDMLSILDIDEVFADAVHVATMEEYRTAKDEGVAAIIIEADLTLDEEYNYVDVALMVSEGVTVNIDAADEEEFGEMYLQGGAVLVNYGTITGALNTVDWNDDDVTDYATVINYGILDYDTICLQAEGRLLNYGTMRVGYYEIQNMQIYNMGSISMTGSEKTGEYEIFIRHAFYNYGDLRIESEAPESGRVEISLEGTTASLTNTGTLVLGENSNLYSSTKIHNCGTISLETENAELVNYGMLYSNESTSVLRAVEGSNWISHIGAVLYSEDSTVDIPDSSSIDLLCFGWSTSALESVRQVSSENDLNIALVDENCKCIILDDDSVIEVSGDLILTDKLLVMDGDSTLIIRDGDLAISGENGGLYGRGGTINLYGGSLILEDGAIALLETSDLLENCVGMTVHESAKFMTTSGEAALTGMTIDFSEGGGVFNSLYGLELYSCNLILSDCWFFSYNGLGFYNSNVQVLSGGTLFIDSPVEYENLFLDEKSTLTIEEGGNVERGGSQTIIEGSVENAGELIIRNTSYVAISGSLVNTDTGVLKFGNEIILTGTLDNQGVIYAVEDGNAVITMEGDGSFTGNEPETVETDTFYW